eukprot:8818105-Pyramimonas_sp.AAC.1
MSPCLSSEVRTVSIRSVSNCQLRGSSEMCFRECACGTLHPRVCCRCGPFIFVSAPNDDGVEASKCGNGGGGGGGGGGGVTGATSRRCCSLSVGGYSTPPCCST